MKLILAGGGTGGHLFPALAIAETLMSEDPSSQVLFVGTKRGIEARLIPSTGFPIKFVSARGLMRTGILNSIKAGVEIPVGIMQSIKIIRSFQPDFVLGVGGYASAPTVAAALVLNVETGIQEQNSIMGAANRMLAKFVNKIFISWENTSPITPESKTFLVGNPVRSTLFRTQTQRTRNDGFNILVFGGSRGADSLNLGMIEHLNELKALAPRIKIAHQTGSELYNKVKKAYEVLGFNAEVTKFIDDMGAYYSWADLVVCRAGASSLAEIAALGKPAIVVPFPFAAEDHQTKNASWLAERNALTIIRDKDLNNGSLTLEINRLIANPGELDSMAQNARKIGRPDAARAIIQEILKSQRLAA